MQEILPVTGYNHLTLLDSFASHLDEAIATTPDVDPDLLRRFERAKARLARATNPAPARHSARRR